MEPSRGPGSAHSSPIKGSGARKLGASSYLLELVPDTSNAEAYRHRMHMDGFPAHYQLTTKQEDSPFKHHGTQSMQWVGDHDREAPHFPSMSTKHRLSHAKHRLNQTFDTTTAKPESMTALKDHVMFTESPVIPGVPVVYRSPEEKAANPERLNLDRRQLTVCPILEGEERLRLLNLQHNSISRLQHLDGLRRLVFLDLYDNLVHEITGLGGLVSLRVLMLGRNRIRKISGLQNLIKLDVLDLHGNMIREIEFLNHLSHLRVLNLAGNDLTCVSGLAGLQALAELNLRRNRITHVYEMDELANLQRLFLSHNLIQGFDDAPCLTLCDNLTDLSLDGNPLANATDHRQAVLYRINHLRMLDQVIVTEEERQEALAVTREEEESRREKKRQVMMEQHREAAISAIKVQWEATHPVSSLCLESTSSPHLADVGTCAVPRADPSSLACASLPHVLSPSTPGCYVEHTETTLHLYGGGALETAAPLHSKQPIQQVSFNYLEFEDIARWLPKLIHICPSVTSLMFKCTNMTGLEQLNALAQLTTPLNSLTISSHGNPITRHPLFSTYTLYRLSHLGLAQLNGEPVRDKDLVRAEQLFGRLSQFTTSHLPQARLLALISKYRPQGVKKAISNSTIPTKSSTCSEPVSRVGLHHFSPQAEPLSVAQQDRVSTARSFCDSLLSSTLLTHSKLRAFEELWPQVVAKLVHTTVQEYSDMDLHMKNMLEEL